MVLKRRADVRQGEVPHVLIHENDAMRVSHRDASHAVTLPRDLNRGIHGPPPRLPFFPFHEDGDFRRLQLRRTHVHPDQDSLPALFRDLQMLIPRQGMDGEILLRRKPPVIDIFGHATDGVPAHLALGPVRVIHAHLEIRLVGGANQHQPIAPDPEMPVADEFRDFTGIRERLPQAVHVNIIIPYPVHFRKFHPAPLPSPPLPVSLMPGSSAIRRIQ